MIAKVNLFCLLDRKAVCACSCTHTHTHYKILLNQGNKYQTPISPYGMLRTQTADTKVCFLMDTSCPRPPQMYFAQISTSVKQISSI